MKNLMLFLVFICLITCKSEAEPEILNINRTDNKFSNNSDNEKIDSDELRTTELDSAFDISFDLNEIEESESGYDYETVIKNYAGNLTNDFIYVKFRNFVVFSNLGEELTYKLIDNDIRNVYDAMYKNYLTVKPQKVTGVFLFKNFTEYMNFSTEYIDIPEDDLSPFGYYKISKNVVVVRYIDWKGSLPHEITHALIQIDFPNISSWFDEGIGTLHERASIVDGKLIGKHNERLRALKRAINDGRFTGIEEMMRTSDENFYGKNSPLYYAIARYVTGYLQHLGLLEKFYKTYKSTVFNDRSGVSQLEKLLGKNISEISDDITEYVLSINTESSR
ncbi:MAG TPA: hypothetical protein PLG90_08185 [Ignavibacteria bacterium]|nr:hypothetical protein [Ignavibacteria bacterium]